MTDLTITASRIEFFSRDADFEGVAQSFGEFERMVEVIDDCEDDITCMLTIAKDDRSYTFSTAISGSYPGLREELEGRLESMRNDIRNGACRMSPGLLKVYTDTIEHTEWAISVVPETSL